MNKFSIMANLCSTKWGGALFFILLLAMAACQPAKNVTVVEDAPITPSKNDTTETDKNFSTSFSQLTIGENRPVQTLDPLFADNGSTMRVIQQIYEGLVRYGQRGQIIPASAKSWTISGDSLTYRFTLRKDLYYHDSNIFASGRGEQLGARDVKKVFERMAKATVPAHAARLFMNIEGFEPYFQEHHNVFLASNRHLSIISGIQTPNDSTVVFHLTAPDDMFLEKLASPYAVIYPMEALPQNNDTDHFVAVGTGPFYLSQHRNGSHYILTQFDNYHEPNQPNIDRVDIITDSNIDLLEALKNGEIQIISQLTPQQVQRVTSQNGTLKALFADEYLLLKPGGYTRIALHFNEGADLLKASVVAALSAVNPAAFFLENTPQSLKIDWSLPAMASSSPVDTISVSQTSDPYAKAFLEKLSTQLASTGIVLEVKPVQVPTRNIELYFTQQFFDYPGGAASKSKSVIVTLQIPHVALAAKKVRQLRFNKHLWWLNLRSIVISAASDFN